MRDERGTIRDVIERDICVGCGACAIVANGPIRMAFLDRGYFQADLGDATESIIRRASAVCPFSDLSRNESEIANEAFPDAPEADDRVGRYHALYTGRVADEAVVRSTSSGGMTSWLAARLLESGAVDGIVQVGSGADEPVRSPEVLFRYEVVESTAGVVAGRKSRYYPVTFADALASIRGNGKRYAFIGVPCQVRAARLVADQARCSLSSLRTSWDSSAGTSSRRRTPSHWPGRWACPPARLQAVDFRIKDPEGTAKSYKFGARAADETELRTSHMVPLVGGRWGHAVFQLGACDFCDDVFAETADVVLGDAWLPEYEASWRGTNVVVTRDASLDAMIREGAENGELELRPLSVEDAARSQAGNFRHRREGLAVRLADDMDAGLWVPRKRVPPSRDGVSPERVEVVRARRTISKASHEAFLQAKSRGSLDHYLEAMRPLIAAHSRAAAVRVARSGGPGQACCVGREEARRSCDSGPARRAKTAPRAAPYRPCDEFRCSPIGALLKGPFYSENYFALIAALTLVATIASGFRSGRWLTCLLSVVVLVATGGRSSQVAASAGIVAIWLTARVIRRRISPQALSRLFAWLVPPLIGAGGIWLVDSASPATLTRRGTVWVRAREALNGHELLGRGVDRWAGYEGYMQISGHFPHNVYLLLMFLGGLVALVLYVVAVARSVLAAGLDEASLTGSIGYAAAILVLGLSEITTNLISVDGLSWVLLPLFAGGVRWRRSATVHEFASVVRGLKSEAGRNLCGWRSRGIGRAIGEPMSAPWAVDRPGLVDAIRDG